MAVHASDGSGSANSVSKAKKTIKTGAKKTRRKEGRKKGREGGAPHDGTTNC